MQLELGVELDYRTKHEKPCLADVKVHELALFRRHICTKISPAEAVPQAVLVLRKFSEHQQFR